MADKKTELMAQFYAECQRKGYIDMTDDIQSLKAKVIATDFKLNYGNIVSFYEKAKNSYEQVQKEKAEAERLRAIRQQKEAQEQARRQVNGELLVTLSDRAYESDETTSVRVYIRPDDSVYCTFNNGSKIEGVPKISIKQGGALLLTYHPSQAVYTGATVGGITTGGVHYTQSGYTASKTHSGKGDIEISVGGISFTLRLVKMSGHTCDLFKRDGQFISLVHNREIKCYVESDKANLYYESIKTGRLDHQTMMNALSMAADEQRLSYAMCEGIINLLGRIVHGQFPPSDEQIYDSAKALENASTSAELNRAIELYTRISEYKDAAKRACDLREKYEEILQAEKEQAILEREARTKKNKRMAIILIPILAILIVAAVIISNSVKKSNAYENALALLDAGQYAEAIEALTALDGYKDSVEKIEYAEQEKAYSDAISLLENNLFSEAITAFESMDGYRDSIQQVYESKYLWALHCLEVSEDRNAYELLTELADLGYKESSTYLADFIYLPSAVTIADGKKILCDYDLHGNVICGLIKMKPDYSVLVLDTSYAFPNETFMSYPVFDSIEYTYNEDGSFIRQYGFSVTSSTSIEYMDSFNAKGQCISRYRYFDSDDYGSSSEEYIFEYYDNGRYRKLSHLSDGEISWVREYEEDGTFTSTSYRFPSLNDNEKDTTDEYNNITCGDNNYQYTYDYDENGNLVHREVYQGNTKVMYTYYSYDEYGYLYRQNGIDRYGQEYSTEFSYEYGYFYCPDAA